MKIARFPTDPTGYVIHPDDEPRDAIKSLWVRAKVGNTDTTCIINLKHCYVIEDHP